MRAAQKHFIDKRLVTDTAMFSLGVSPFQGCRVKADVNIPVFSETFWRPAPCGAFYMQSLLYGFFKSQRFLRRDPARL